MEKESLDSLSKGQFFEEIIENNKHVMLIIDPESGKILFANKAACDYYQYNYHELISLSIYEINILSIEEIDQEMKKAKSEQRNLFNFKHQLKSGEVRNVEVISRPIKISRGEYLLSIIMDAHYNNRLRLMLNDVFYKSADAIVLLDQSKNIFAVNESFLKLFGYSKDELINQRLDDFLFPDFMNVETHYKLAYEGKITNLDTVRRKKDGSLIEVNVMIVPFIVGEEIIGAQVVYRDNSVQKKLDHEMQLLKEILQNSKDGVLIKDDKMTILWANKSFENLTGYKLEEIINKNSITCLLNKTDLDFDKTLKHIENNGEWQGKISFRKNEKIKNNFWLHVITLIDKKNDIINYVAFLKGI